jgi:hypothetical protein
MHKIQVLLGPSSQKEVENINWGSASVSYLQKFRTTSSDDACKYVRYDHSHIQSEIERQPIEGRLAKLILSLNYDPNCRHLAERERSELFSGSFLAPIEIANCTRYAWLIIKKHDPAVIVFHNHPHDLFLYVLAKTALFLNITVLMVHFSALPWRASISRFHKNRSIEKLRIRNCWTDDESKLVGRYVGRLQSTHNDAIPVLDRKWLGYNSSAISVADEFRLLSRGEVLKNIYRVLIKLNWYRAFKRHLSYEIKRPYVVFFMHYQPEESTIPRGGVFAQQLNAIMKLRSLLPSDVNILVKENRATYRAPVTLAIAVRSQKFYRSIVGLPSTYLIPTEFDTFSLIDRAQAVATVTGTVGLESLCRGKKVIIFGSASYASFSGVINLGSSKTTLNWLPENLEHDWRATQRDLLNELMYSFGGHPPGYHSDFKSQQAATIEAFEYLSINLSRFVNLNKEP